MVASVLAAGDVAIIGYNSEDTGSPNRDTISFLLLTGIGAGTQIFFTDRTWNGTSFAAPGGGEGSYAFTAASDMAAGSVVTISTTLLNAAGIDLSDLGETIYVYQGSDADTPTTFLYALDGGDENTTFDGNLTNTGLSAAAGTATAIRGDNAMFAGRGHNIPAEDLLAAINDDADWTQSATNPQPAPSNSLANAPDQQLWVAGAGGGHAIVRIDRDGSGNYVGEDPIHLYQNSVDNLGTPLVAEGFFRPTDIFIDSVHQKLFIADSNGSGQNRILQIDLAAVAANPGAPPVATILYQDVQVGTGIVALEGDIERGILYFGEDTHLYRINYDTAGQARQVVGHLGTNVFVQDFVLDLDAAGNGSAYLINSQVTTSFGVNNISRNFLYKISGITPTSTSPVATVNGVQQEFTPNDVAQTGVISPNADPQAFPEEHGALKGIDIDPATKILYFTTQSVALDHDGVGATPPQTQFGGVFSYATLGNPTGLYNILFKQDGVNGPDGLLYYIHVDPLTGRYYVGDITGGPGANLEDQEVWVGALSGGTPTLFANVANIGGLAPLGLVLETAPTLTGTFGGTYNETAGAGSGFGPGATAASGLTAGDFDSGALTDQLAGAQVRISSGFGSSPGSAEQLTINGTTSGTIELGAKDIAYSYNAATGVMTLSGVQTLDNYEAALALVAYSISGDNPDNYGDSPTRTLSYSLYDGLLYSDESHAAVNVGATNDAPVNTVGGPVATSEDTPVAVTGLSVSDVDADPAADVITVTLSVSNGTINVAPGAASLAGNGTASVVLTGTQNDINAMLAAVNGVTYTPNGDYNGADSLQMVSNDGGNSGTGGAQSDSDSVAITIGAAADIADDNATTNEDTAVNVLVLGNDSFEGTPAITGTTNGANGTVTVNDNGTPGNTADDYVVYTPNADYNGSDSFTYTVTSGGATETATVNVTVDPVADIADDSVMVAEDSVANALDLLANDSFEDLGRSITAVTQGVNGGTVAIDDNGTPGDTTDDFVTYTPAPNYAGPDSFTYTVTSGGVTETATVNVNVTGDNDDPVNITGGPVAATEDGSVAVTGLQVSDIDSPSLSVTLSVTRGILTVNTGVPGGVAAASGNGTASVTISGTQAEINATLAAASGLVYTPTPNVNGPDTLTMATSDGSGGSDTDMVAISVAAVNDAPTVAGDGTESAAPIVQDMPSPTGQSVASLFAGQYSDAADQVAGGSSADAFAGVAVTANGSGATGQWQYHNGVTWVNIGPASDGAAVLLSESTSIRFNPAPGFFGAAPTLTVHLVNASGGALVSGTIVNASVTGGTTRYSGGTVVLSETVIAGNTPPTGVNGTLQIVEDANNGATVGTVTATDPDSSTFTYTLVNDAGGRFNISTSGVVTVENGLLLDYEQNSSHTIRVRVDDNEGGISEFDMNVAVTDDHGEFVTGDGANHIYYGGAETDFLFGGHGSDTIRGQGGIDFIFGGDGLFDSTDAGDNLNGGSGSDVILGNGGDDIIAGGTDTDVLSGNEGNDTIYGGESAADTVDMGNDIISGDAGNDILHGNGGNDYMLGGDNNDELFGGAGSDDLFGDSGVDRLAGGTGADSLTGGSGFDVFILRKGQANGDVLEDFDGNGSGAGDTIRLEGYAAGTTFTKISGDTWRINDHGFIEFVTIHADGNVHSTDYGFFP